jgi:hypothetical protein
MALNTKVCFSSVFPGMSVNKYFLPKIYINAVAMGRVPIAYRKRWEFEL